MAHAEHRIGRVIDAQDAVAGAVLHRAPRLLCPALPAVRHPCRVVLGTGGMGIALLLALPLMHGASGALGELPAASLDARSHQGMPRLRVMNRAVWPAVPHASVVASSLDHAVYRSKRDQPVCDVGGLQVGYHEARVPQVQLRRARWAAPDPSLMEDVGKPQQARVIRTYRALVVAPVHALHDASSPPLTHAATASGTLNLSGPSASLTQP